MLMSSVGPSMLNQLAPPKQAGSEGSKLRKSTFRNNLSSKVKELEMGKSNLNLNLEAHKSTAKELWPTQFNTPEYVDKNATFKQWMQFNQAKLNPGSGYIFFKLDPPSSLDGQHYHFGETVKGVVFFELFHQSIENKIFLRLQGKVKTKFEQR